MSHSRKDTGLGFNNLNRNLNSINILHSTRSVRMVLLH